MVSPIFYGSSIIILRVPILIPHIPLLHTRNFLIPPRTLPWGSLYPPIDTMRNVRDCTWRLAQNIDILILRFLSRVWKIYHIVLLPTYSRLTMSSFFQYILKFHRLFNGDIMTTFFLCGFPFGRFIHWCCFHGIWTCIETHLWHHGLKILKFATSRLALELTIMLLSRYLPGLPSVR